MPVYQVTESPEERTFDMAREGQKIVRRYTRSFDVFTNYDGTGPLQVAVTSGLPLIGDSYVTPEEHDLGAYVERISPRQMGDDPYHWKVQVAYSSDVKLQLTGSDQGKNDSTANIAANPLRKPALISYALRNSKGILEQDYSLIPKAIAASNGEKFDPPLEEDKYNLVITIVRNRLTYDGSLALRYAGRTSSEAWFGFAAGVPRLIDWRGDPAEDNGLVYYVNRWEIELQYPDWTRGVLNQGSFGYTNDTKRLRVDHFTSNGTVLAKGLLDGYGSFLPDTVATAAIAIGVQVVTPANMTTNGTTIQVGGTDLLIDPGTPNQETVRVSAATATTFTANFVRAHNALPVVIQGVPTYQNFKVLEALPFSKLPIFVG